MHFRRITAAALSAALLFAGLFGEVLHSHSHDCDSSNEVAHSHTHANGTVCPFHQGEEDTNSDSTPSNPLSDCDHGCSICSLLANSWETTAFYSVTTDEGNASEPYLFPATTHVASQPLSVPNPRGPPVA